VSAADTIFPQIRPLDSGAPSTSRWAQADFYLPGDLITLLNTDSGVRVTLLQISTDTPDHYARLFLDTSTFGRLHASMALAPRSAQANPDWLVTEGWHSMALGLELPPPGGRGAGTITFVLDGVAGTTSIEDYDNTGVNVVGAWGLGSGISDATAPWLVIENLCFAEDQSTAAVVCAPMTTADAGPADAGGVDGATPMDSSTPVDGSTTMDSGGRRDGSGSPSLSFRGSGGCECRVSGPAREAFGAMLLLALPTWLAWRRHQRPHR
jgi:hypothetical protein